MLGTWDKTLIIVAKISKYLGIIFLILFSIHLTTIKENIYNDFFNISEEIIATGILIAIIVVILVLVEVGYYSEKFYEILSKKNYLKTHQNLKLNSSELNITPNETKQIIIKLEKSIIKNSNWLLSSKNENLLIFYTLRKNILLQVLLDEVKIEITKKGLISLQSKPKNKWIITDNARNLRNIQYILSVIKK